MIDPHMAHNLELVSNMMHKISSHSLIGHTTSFSKWAYHNIHYQHLIIHIPQSTFKALMCQYIVSHYW